MPGPDEGDFAAVFRSGRYEIRECIGQGAMGLVYHAFDRETQRAVALKTLRFRDPEEIYRLKREFRALADLAHPNLVERYDLVVDEDQCFFTMELIDGVTFPEFVRPGPPPARAAAGGERGSAALDAVRLRQGFRQLALGLRALHDAGKLHRDVKPTNVLVERGGRVVLLDFGLVSGTQSELSRASREGTLAGTFGYMAPEQAWGEEISAAADWYSAGVVLYECLTGRLPFEGRGLDVLLERRSSAPPSPRSLVPDTPADLDALAVDLLDPRPEQRPSAEAVLKRLSGGSVEPGEEAPSPRTPPKQPFVGRRRELDRLRRAFEASRRGATVVLRVEGPSGIGKTALLERFLSEIEARRGALVLRSRCHPHEAVSFKAVDEMVDGLSRFLVRQEAARIEALMPRNVRALQRVFPVLGRVPFPVPETEGDLAEADLKEVRRRAFAALRELMARIGDRQPLVLWIDDIEWGDLDSAPLLRELLGSGEAPSMLALVSCRSEGKGALLAALEVSGTVGAQESTLALGPLSSGESLELVEELLDGLELEVAGELPEIADESGGSPFFIGELIRALLPPRERGGAETPTRALRLSEVVADRVRALGDAARGLLEVVCVAAGPIDRDLAIEALGLGERGRAVVDQLCRESLLRYAPLAREFSLEAYHDRIRDAVLQKLSEAGRRRHHRELARALEVLGHADPGLLARHLAGAGDLGRAAEFAGAAGDRAAEELAFVRAGEFYRLALEWNRHDPERTRTLLTRRADALVNAGHCGEAAPLYLEAARGAPAADSRELRRRGAEQYLLSGWIDEGVAVLRPLLREAGLRYPSTARSAMLATMAHLGALALRGTRFRARPEAEFSPGCLERVDLCYSTAKGLVAFDPVRSSYMCCRALRLALQAGEPARVGRSLTTAGGAVLTPLGGPFAAWGGRMIERARAIARKTDDPYLWAAAAISEGQVGVLTGQWHAAVERSEEAIAILQERCRAVIWECDLAYTALLRGLEELGRMREAERQARRLATEADELGDRYGATVGALYLGVARVAEGDVAGARSAVEGALGHWSRQEWFLLQQLYALRVEAYADLFEGRPEVARERIASVWPAIRRASLLRVPVTRIDCLLLRSRVSLAMAHREAASRAGYLRRCERDAGRLGREGRADTSAHAALLRAGVAATRGEPARAVRLIDEGIGGYEQAGMALYRACALRRKGEILGGDEGAELVATADGLMSAEGIGEPSRWADVCAPGFEAASRSPGSG